MRPLAFFAAAYSAAAAFFSGVREAPEPIPVGDTGKRVFEREEDDPAKNSRGVRPGRRCGRRKNVISSAERLKRKHDRIRNLQRARA